MADSKFLDSSVWLDYFINGKHKEIIESDSNLFTSILSIFETKKKLLKINYEVNDVNKALAFLKRRSLIVPLNIEIIEKAVDISLKHKLATIDSLIYSSSMSQSTKFLTLDRDFTNLPEAVIL